MHISYITRVVVLLGVVFGSIFLTSPVQASTPFPGQNGRIAYTKIIDGQPSIWTMQPDGSEQRRIARGAHSPQWSPDGRTLVFVGGSSLQLIDANGHNRRILTPTLPGKEHTPRWSRDGKTIAFVNERHMHGAVRSAIFIVDAYNRKTTNISGWPNKGSGYRAPSMAPDNKQLVYERYGEGFRGLLITNIQTKHTRELTAITDHVASSYVAWSPDGKKILYNDSDQEIYTIWSDGTHRTVISDGESYRAAWSPDGKRVAFLEDPNDDHISLSEADGTVVWRPIEKGEYDTIGAPAWSSDGTQLAFTLSNEGESALFVFTLDKEESTPVKLTDGEVRDLTWQAR